MQKLFDNEPVEKIFRPAERLRHLAGTAGHLAAIGMSFCITKLVDTYDGHRRALGQPTMFEVPSDQQKSAE